MSLEDGRFAGIPDPNRMDYFDPYMDLAELKPGNIVETADGNSARNHSERLGLGNVENSSFTPMSPGREYSIQDATRQQSESWNSRFE